MGLGLVYRVMALCVVRGMRDGVVRDGSVGDGGMG